VCEHQISERNPSLVGVAPGRLKGRTSWSLKHPTETAGSRKKNEFRSGSERSAAGRVKEGRATPSIDEGGGGSRFAENSEGKS